MGAEASGLIDDAHTAAGYYSIDREGDYYDNYNNLIETKDFQDSIKKKQLFQTPFNAKWQKETLLNNLNPRYGQCTVFSSVKSLMYIAFGQTENGSLLSDLVSFDSRTLHYKSVIDNIAEPRTNASMTADGKYLYIFGGNSGSKYFNDFLRIDVDKKSVEKLPTADAEAPCARSSAVIACYNHKVFVWGGNAGLEVDNDIHVFDPFQNKWAKYSTTISSLFKPGYAQNGQYCYIFGSSSKYNLLRLDMENNTVEELHAKGTSPQSTVNSPSLVAYNNYVFCFGGTSDYLYTHLFAYDIENNWWFVFHIKPAKEDISLGEITDLGLFKVPRQDGQSVMLDPASRTIFHLFGNRFEKDSPVYSFKLAKPLAYVNERDDLLHMLH